MNGQIVTFGELMLRLSPPEYLRIKQTMSFDATFAGSEANVAVCLTNFGLHCKYVSKVPDTEIGQASINSLRTFGVDIDYIVRGGDRLGLFYVEKGAAQRPSKVLYDRKYSSFSLAEPSEYDWNVIFSNSRWFHFSGITPALGNKATQACVDACRVAKEKGLTVSCDLNYRKTLWDNCSAKKTMTKLIQNVDICFANEEDIGDVFGIYPNEAGTTGGAVNADGYKQIAKAFLKKFHLKKVVISLRHSLSANDNQWSGMSFDGLNYCFSTQYDVHIVDRVGSGDSFAAGYIYAQVMKYEEQKAIEFATAVGCLKHSIEGDYNLVSVNEVNDLVDGNTTGRVWR